MTIQEQIYSKLLKIAKNLGASDVSFALTPSSNLSFGDYSSNIAMVLSKKIGKNPMDLASEIKEGLEGVEGLEKIEIVKPGFMNFWLKKDEISSQIFNVLKNQDQAVISNKTKNPRKELYENTQPNTNKPLHIGHLRNTALGESMVHLRKAIGHNALSVNINNDRGSHICKAMFGYLCQGQAKGDSLKAERWDSLLDRWIKNPSDWKTPGNTEKSDHFVGRYYVEGDKAEKENSLAKAEIQEMLQAWEQKDPKVLKLWKQMNEWFYQGFKQTHARFLGIKPNESQFTKEWYESELYERGKEIIMKHIGDVFHRREDGAVIAKLEKFNLPDKVALRSDDTSLYLTFDLELSRIAIEGEKADLFAHVVGNEQELYFRQLFAISELLGFGRRENFLHISYGMVNLAGGVKMSSREGNVITADDLMDKAYQMIKNKFPETEDATAEIVAIGAIKYSMLKYNPKVNIAFDLEESISFEGNSGPYLQYTYARTQSVLAKGNPSTSLLGVNSRSELRVKGERGKREEERTLPFTLNALPLNTEEQAVLRLLYRFSEVVEVAAQQYSPNVVCTYLFELAQKFNLFYQKHKILSPVIASDSEAISASPESKSSYEIATSPTAPRNDDVYEFRLFLTEATGVVLKRGLHLLGIKAPERM